MSSYQNIAIIKLSSLGDIIHTLPAFDILRRHFPESRISWLVEPSGAKLLENVDNIDEIIPINLKIRGVKNKFIELRRILKKYRNRFDLIIDFQGLLKSAVLSRLLKSTVFGFHQSNLKESWARFFYSRKADVFDENRHVITKNIHLLHLLGISNGDIHYPLKKRQSSPRLTAFLQEHSLIPRKFTLLNIGGGWQTKLLDIDQYIEIANRLKKKYPALILWGNEKERQLAEVVSESSHIPMSIFLNFDELIDIIGQASLLITGDTLAMHVADMMNTPSVGIFGPTSPTRNGSLLKNSKAVFNQMDCSFCYKKNCDRMLCLKAIHIDDLENKVSEIYEKYN
jgi:heptosyltransferase-1